MRLNAEMECPSWVHCATLWIATSMCLHTWISHWLAFNGCFEFIWEKTTKTIKWTRYYRVLYTYIICIYIPIYSKVVHKYLFECCPSDCHWQCILAIDSNPWDFPSAPACRRFRQTTIRPQVGSLWPWILRGPYANLFRGCCEAGVGWVQTVLERQQDLMLSTIIQSPQGFLSTNIRWKRCSKVMRVLGKAIMKTKVFDKNDALWKLKAYNGRVVCAWLAHATLKLARAAPSPERLILADCMSPPEIFFEHLQVHTEHFELRAKLPVCSSDWIPLLSGAPRARCKWRLKMLAGICHLFEIMDFQYSLP